MASTGQQTPAAKPKATPAQIAEEYIVQKIRVWSSKAELVVGDDSSLGTLPANADVLRQVEALLDQRITENGINMILEDTNDQRNLHQKIRLCAEYRLMELGFQAQSGAPTSESIATVGNLGTFEMPAAVAKYDEANVWGPGTDLGELESRGALKLGGRPPATTTPAATTPTQPLVPTQALVPLPSSLRR